MRKFIFLAVSVLAMQTLSASSLIVEAIDGTSLTYTMESVRMVDFTTAGSLKIVKTDGTADTKSISDTRKLIFTSQPQTAASEACSSSFKVFPNPVSDELTVVDAKGDILLFTASGNLISKTKANDDSTVIPVNNLTDGIYILRNGNNAVKIIKSK